jgi:hypothetical protein
MNKNAAIAAGIRVKEIDLTPNSNVMTALPELAVNSTKRHFEQTQRNLLPGQAGIATLLGIATKVKKDWESQSEMSKHTTHLQWHTRRGIRKSGCKFCEAELGQGGLPQDSMIKLDPRKR